jgi:putative holliday junction resolvase
MIACMKYLGIDFGTKRVGIAMSDESGAFAFPKEIIPFDKAYDRIVFLCKEETISTIVIGASLATNEQENELFMKAQRFADRIVSETKTTVFFEREDFSSVEAHRFQTDAGPRDDSAAAIILQRFLDKKKK